MIEWVKIEPNKDTPIEQAHIGAEVQMIFRDQDANWHVVIGKVVGALSTVHDDHNS